MPTRMYLDLSLLLFFLLFPFHHGFHSDSGIRIHDLHSAQHYILHIFPRSNNLIDRPPFILEQSLKLPRCFSDNSKCILECPSQEIKLVNDTLHHQSIREVQQLSRSFHLVVYYNVKFAYGVDLMRILRP